MADQTIYGITQNQTLVPINMGGGNNITVGTYTGNGSTSRKVQIDGEIKFCVVFAINDVLSQTITANGDTYIYAGFATQSGSSKGVSITSGGITVQQSMTSPMDGKRMMLNQSGKTYVYVIFG